MKPDTTVALPPTKTASAAPQPMPLKTNPLFGITLDGVDALHLAYDGEDPPVIVLSNKTAQAVALTGAVAFSSVGSDGSDGFALPVDAAFAPDATLRLPIGRLLKKGAWHVTAECETADRRGTAEERFAVVRRRDITPKQSFGTFRIGLNYHRDRYTAEDNEKCLDALVQCGAKLVRAEIDTHFRSGEPMENQFDWQKADAHVAALEERGLAIDAFIAGVPHWAIKEEYTNLPRTVRGAWARPSRPGLFRDYCRAVAAHFGTRIDWYEVGNEWDLVSPDALSDNDAIRMVLEAYEGVKAGCPAAKVIPGGWAGFWPYNLPGDRQPMRSLQSRVMVECRGFYDAYPAHEHGLYADFRRRFFSSLTWREANGLGDVPWYANETALTSTRAGEKLAARTLWQKVVFAWTHGSADYIWYSLRGFGYDPYDSEQGYGIMTGDFHPRATYAAFAGLTSCIGGMEPLGILHEGPHREIYAFRSRAGAGDRIVLVAWDGAAAEQVRVRVRTDAVRAFRADLFDNRDELTIRDGEVVFDFAASPTALILEGATRAEPNTEDLSRGEVPAIREIDLSADAATMKFELVKFTDIYEIYKADPANIERVWRGWWDLVAWIEVRRDGDSLAVSADVNDECLTEGDSVVVLADGVAIGRITDRKLRKQGATYSGSVTLPPTGARMEIRVMDADGLGPGPDGWATTGEFIFKR